MTKSKVTYVNWGNDRIKLTWMPTTDQIDAQCITSAHAICFYEGKIMLVDINGRGYDIPGGHIEFGESAVDCCIREVMEEGYVKGNAYLIGYLEVNHCENVNWTPASKYPRVAYQAMYRFDITEVLPFEAQYEAARRLFVPVEEFSTHHNSFTPQYDDIIEAALNMKEVQ